MGSTAEQLTKNFLGWGKNFTSTCVTYINIHIHRNYSHTKNIPIQKYTITIQKYIFPKNFQGGGQMYTSTTLGLTNIYTDPYLLGYTNIYTDPYLLGYILIFILTGIYWLFIQNHI